MVTLQGSKRGFGGLGQSAKDDISAGGIWRWRDKAEAVGDSRQRILTHTIKDGSGTRQVMMMGGKFWRLFPFLHS